MCVHHSADTEHSRFVEFCIELKERLLQSELLDPPLAAALELLERRVNWFQCEAAHVAWYAEDMHSALGAGVVLSLWNGVKARG